MYNRAVINYSIRWGRNVGSDLDDLYDTNEQYGALIDELFDLLAENSDLRVRLATQAVSHISPRFTTVPIESAIREHFNLYRIKLWLDSSRLMPFRVIYAVDHSTSCIWILAVMKRKEGEDGYESKSPLGKRLRDDYEHHRIVRIGGTR